MRVSALKVASVLCALLALGAIAVACGDDKKDEGSAQSSSSAAATPRPTPDPATLAKQAADTVEKLKSFHFLLEHENGGSPIVLGLTMNRAEGDIVQPDRLKADINAVSSQLGNANVNVKVVSIGDKAQITNPFNPRQWVPLPGDNKLADIFDPAAGTTAALRSATNVKIVGEDTINGVKVWKLEGDVDAGSLTALTPIAEPGYIVKGTAWIGQDTPNVYRIRIDGPLGSKDTKNIVRKVDLSKFNEPITIDPPSS